MCVSARRDDVTPLRAKAPREPYSLPEPAFLRV
jgi:hypothetical protein